VSALQWLSLCADIFGIAGFGITLWLLFLTKGINSALAMRIRIPQLVDSLDYLAVGLVRKLKNWAVEQKSIDADLAKIKGSLIILSEKLKNDERKLARRILGHYEKRRWYGIATPIRTMDEDQVWLIRQQLLELITRCREREEDQKWKVSDGN
jgi:hypothetical protein